MSCADRVALMREMRATHIILVGKPEEVDHLGHVTRRLEDKNNVGRSLGLSDPPTKLKQAICTFVSASSLRFQDSTLFKHLLVLQ